MKSKVAKTFPIIALIGLLAGCGTYGTYGDYSDYYGMSANSYSVTIWTNTDSDIDVFIDGQRVGTVTEKYDQAPECGAAGCVVFSTEEGGTKVTLRGESIDGKTKWEEKSFRLNRSCRKVQLITNEEGVPVVEVN